MRKCQQHLDWLFQLDPIVILSRICGDQCRFAQGHARPLITMYPEDTVRDAFLHCVEREFITVRVVTAYGWKAAE